MAKRKTRSPKRKALTKIPQPIARRSDARRSEQERHTPNLYGDDPHRFFSVEGLAEIFYTPTLDVWGRVREGCLPPPMWFSPGLFGWRADLLEYWHAVFDADGFEKYKNIDAFIEYKNHDHDGWRADLLACWDAVLVLGRCTSAGAMHKLE